MTDARPVLTSVSPTLRRSAWLEIDLDAIRHNVEVIRRVTRPAAIAAVVKADAYGHGAARVAAALTDVTDALCVATLDEAIALRAHTEARLLSLYPVPAHALGEALAVGVELTLMSEADVRAVEDAAAAAKEPVAVQLCVETGFGRGGVRPEGVTALAARIGAHPRLRLAGLWSHLSTPEDAEISRRQAERFESAGAALRAAGLPLPPRHLAASGGIFSGSAPALDLVRPGLALYGVLDEASPIAEATRAAAAELRPAMSVKARAVAFSEIPTGETVGYGGRWRAPRPSRVAILPLGYGDGFLRGSQPGAVALVHGVRAPLVGVISMDALAVDITDVEPLEQAPEFVLLGRQGRETIGAGELARRRNTIAWEVLCSMARRLDRVYYRDTGPGR